MKISERELDLMFEEKYWDAEDKELAEVEWINIMHDSRKPGKKQHVLLREGNRSVHIVTYRGGNQWEAYRGDYIYIINNMFWGEIPEQLKGTEYRKIYSQDGKER